MKEPFLTFRCFNVWGESDQKRMVNLEFQAFREWHQKEAENEAIGRLRIQTCGNGEHTHIMWVPWQPISYFFLTYPNWHHVAGSDVIFSFIFFCIVMLQMLFAPCDRCQSWFVVHHERLGHDTDTEEDASSHKSCCTSSSKVSCACNFCGVSMAILLCISFLSQIIGCFIYASSPVPSWSDSEPSIAYWCSWARSSAKIISQDHQRPCRTSETMQNPPVAGIFFSKPLANGRLVHNQCFVCGKSAIF